MSRKVRGTGSRNLAHAILREAHLGCIRDEEERGGWMDAFKIWEREPGREVHSSFPRRNGKGEGGGTHERKMEVSKVQEGGRRRRGRISPTTGVGERRVSSRGKKNDPLI